jgi:uncharacterized membrane protein YedE/YeeE
MRERKPYWNAYVGGVVLGLVLFASFILTGNGLGASGGIGRVVLAAEKAVAPHAVDTSATRAKWGGGEKNPLDHWLVWAVLGAAVGGFVSGWLGGRVKFETNKGPHVSVKTRWIMASIGGVIMGYGARVARGCTSGQALSGGATMSLGSWALMFAIFGGAFLFAYPLRRFWN